MDINIENLIKVIEKHTILYDTNNKEYYDRIKKKRAWEEVCANLNSEWDTFDDEEQASYFKEVHKKWQSLRDCFRRELIIKKTPPNNGKRKVKYKYFDALEFLTPFTQSGSTESSASVQEGGTIAQKDLETSSSTKDPLSEDTRPSRKRKLSTAYIEEIPVLNEGIQDNTIHPRFVDDDEAFLFSLLPSFKEYNLDQKFSLRIELMKTILKFNQSQKSLKIVKSEMVDEDYSN